ncbi:MAG: hypothetical protein Q9190_004970, partial [Brigantiaea leucoxantha]
MRGQQSDMDFDAMAEIVFEGEEEWKAFLGELNKKENKERVEEDEAKFQDKGKLRAVMVDETYVTKGKKAEDSVRVDDGNGIERIGNRPM